MRNKVDYLKGKLDMKKWLLALCIVMLPSTAMAKLIILSASYGVNCSAGLYGNQTANLRVPCQGQSSCTYTVVTRDIGDPAVGCAKTYEVYYTCNEISLNIKTLSAEANGKTLTLQCP